MNLRPDEITGIIKEQIKNYSSKLELKDIGTVVTVGDGIATVHGLENCPVSFLNLKAVFTVWR